MWRNTMLPIRFYAVDARALVPFFVCLLHWSWRTFYMALAGIALFAVLEWCGLTFPAALRTLRRLAAGRTRSAVPTWKKRRFA